MKNKKFPCEKCIVHPSCKEGCEKLIDSIKSEDIVYENSPYETTIINRLSCCGTLISNNLKHWKFHKR